MTAVPGMTSLCATVWPAPLGACLATLGDRVLRLQDEPARLFRALRRFGQLEAGTANRACSLWQTTAHGDLEYAAVCGVARLRRGPVTLECFPRQWAAVLAVLAPVAGIAPRSLLCFDAHGALRHQWHVPAGSAGLAFEELVCALLHPDQRDLPRPRPLVAPVEAAHVDLAALEQGWSVLREPADFAGLLRRHGLRRLRAYRLVRDKFARPVSLDSVPALLSLGAARQTPLSLRCGNRGAVQRFEGALPLPAWQGDTLCVRQGGLRFSLSMRDVASVWRVRKPSVDGVVTTIELFDGQDERVLTISGARGYGRMELPSWRALLADSLLPPEPGRAVV